MVKEDQMRTIVGTFVVALLAVPSVASASDRVIDPRGDSTDAPDITAVGVSHTDDALVVEVELAAPLRFSEEKQYTDMLMVMITTDAFVQFATGVHGADTTRAPVTRTGVESGRVGTARVEVDGGTVRLAVTRQLLDEPDEVGVLVAAGREYSQEEAGRGRPDYAPTAAPLRHVLSAGSGPSAVWPLAAAALAAAGFALVMLVLGRGSVRPPAAGIAR